MTEPKEVVVPSPSPPKLKGEAGGDSDIFNHQLLNAVIATLWLPEKIGTEGSDQRIIAGIEAMRALQPADAVEGMIAGQIVAMNAMALECARRAMLRDQPPQIAASLRKGATTASRAFIDMLAALDRKRGRGGQQRVRVEHVHVHDGGQAIVGTVQAGRVGGGGEG